jgi:hypothetical protein
VISDRWIVEEEGDRSRAQRAEIGGQKREIRDQKSEVKGER